MFYRKFGFAVAVLSTAFLATEAGAKNEDNTWVEVDESVLVTPFDETAAVVDDWNVYDSDGNRIGEVEEVIGVETDTASALVVDFDDESEYQADDVIIPLNEVEWVDDVLVLDVEPSKISSKEKYKD